MITWMQKNNKFLIWTIWIATIAFIASGPIFSGAGYGSSKKGNVAKVGEIEISQLSLNMVYGSIYNQTNQQMQGQLDEAKAKEMGLIKQAFARLVTQAKVLNFAKDVGLIVSDEEVAQRLQTLQTFTKDGVFDTEIYKGYLKAQGMKAKTFEATLREELLIQKTLELLVVDALPLETEAVGAAMNVSDKIAYQVLTQADVNLSSTDAEVKTFWEAKKANFMTAQMYDFSVVWTATKETNVSEEEIKNFYDKNSFNYSSAEGKQLPFEEAKTQVTADLKLKKSKKSAQKAYIAFKKGKEISSETLSLPIDDLKFSAETWGAVKERAVGDILKPKVVGDMYATLKIEKITLPEVKSYEAAKEEVSLLHALQAKQKALLVLAEARLKNFDNNASIVTDFVKLDQNVNLESLNSQESLQFLQKLFTSTKEKGIISVRDKIIVYNILEQKLAQIDENQRELVKQTVNSLKEGTFEANFIKILDKKYPTETYVGGLSN
ncbi:MAG: hypothetical protein GQ531_08665 [Sulfurovum sp.]|nr:hypothetical protein [Sulfurovum sp.]